MSVDCLGCFTTMLGTRVMKQRWRICWLTSTIVGPGLALPHCEKVGQACKDGVGECSV